MFYKYYLNERPAGPGAVPKDGLAEYNPDDKGGRYGSVIYRRELTAAEVIEYELTEEPALADGRI